ncbi:histidine phosphatase family protein [Mycoplasma sp. P36-A1]|uniref:histidine phosphatase family protein n=1 Tax=Mycoplasma sp. P36-A1 TaxID=3252900 RepID=UPI003C2BE12C
MKIYFIRHGKTASNLLQVYNGRNDEPLSEDGRNDLESKKGLYKDVKFDYVYASPMTRVRQSIDILFGDINVNELREDLMEMDFGSWVGVKYTDKMKELEALGYTMNDIVDPKGGETFDNLFNRTTEFLKEILEKHNEDDTILVGAHGMVIAAIMHKNYFPEEIFYYLTPDNGLGYIIDTKTKEIKKIKQ